MDGTFIDEASDVSYFAFDRCNPSLPGTPTTPVALFGKLVSILRTLLTGVVSGPEVAAPQHAVLLPEPLLAAYQPYCE